MSLTVQTNLLMMNAQNKFKINTQNKTKTMEKLSSGYRINRAADDAAGLTISEKMRLQIRGLNQGTRNAEDGVSWVQTGDGALNEVHDMLHRMKELTVKSLNETNTAADRAALQAEFDALQSEIDRITGTTQFNTKPIFDDHEPTYFEFEGNVVWNQSQPHVINSSTNTLIVDYRKDASSPVEQVTITIPQGIYTTQELTDEVDSALADAGIDDIVLEYTNTGTFNLCYEGGEKIESVTGGLSYLLYDMYTGGSVGALVGTTVFPTEDSQLEISSKNNHLSFAIEDFDGNSTTKSITLANGFYTRSELIDILNQELAGTNVTAKEYGTGIKLSSDSSIITGFKGNMFQIDTGSDIYTSVFYDNVKYGNISTTSGYFLGAGVIPTAAWDEEHKIFDITSANNTLTFKANGSAMPVSIQIPEGEYTLGSGTNDILDKLNELFADNGLDLNASLRTQGSYLGIRIDSTVKGATSMVGIDSTSSAYATLFTNRVYNVKTENPVFTRDTTSNVLASATGTQTHTGTALPITITAGTNDQFSLKIVNPTSTDTFTITVPAGQYNDASALALAINNQLNGPSATSGYKDMITASATSSGTIKLTANESTGIINVFVEAAGTNAGYEDIFYGEKIDTTKQVASGSGTSSTPASVTLNTVVSDPTELTGSNNSLTITLNGADVTVTLPTGTNVTHDQIEAAIEQQLPGGTTISANTFTTVSGTGNSVNNNFTRTSSGTTTSPSRSYSDVGDSKVTQGVAGSYDYNYPASVTVGATVPSSLTLTGSNNKLAITINGTTKEITLAEDTYSRSEFIDALQNEIDNAFTKYAGGATVSLNSSNQLVFTTRLNSKTGNQIAGKSTSISFDTASSSLMKELHTNRTTASITTNKLKDSMTIDSANNTFVFNYTENSTTSQITLNLTPGTYTPNSLASEIQYQLNQQGIDVKAEISSGALKLTTRNAGSGNGLSYSTTTGGTSATTLFGDMYTHTPASVTTDREIQNSITITDDTKGFSIVANNNTYSFDLQPGTYTSREQFVQMLNDKLTQNNVPIKASLTGNKLTYTTTTAGSTSTLTVSYANGGSSMLPIYGQTTGAYAGIDAEFVDGKLKLTSTLNGGSIKVSSDSGGIFQTPKVTVTKLDPQNVTGYTSTIKSSVDGAALNGSVTIDKWNEDLSFTFVDKGTEKSVSFDLPQKEYTYAELETLLQTEINNDLGDSNLVKVSVSDSGVRFEAVNPGRASYFKDNFSGGFYHKVLTKTTETSPKQPTSATNGNGPKDTAYTIGRKNVKDAPVTIKSGKNDTLTLDLTYSGTVHTITMTLDAGTYQGKSLTKMIQEKLNEQLTSPALGLSENLIEVGIGGINTGVVGANDNTALNFKLSSKVLLPADGQYIIDGVRGNAAFSVFYQTDGELKESYTQGSKDISDGVTISAGKEDLTFEVDGVSYTITLEPKTYTKDEVLTEVNDKLAASGAPVVAEIVDDNLRLTHQKLGPHTISNVDGGAKEDLFFQTNMRDEAEENILIQFSSVTEDDMDIDRPILNTVFLGINSSVITKTKYAKKALDKLDVALDIASGVRSMFGAYQNRLEHSIINNENKSENTQAAESRLRDADMAEEMVHFAVHNIVAQASQAIMSQAGGNAENIVRLLQS